MGNLITVLLQIASRLGHWKNFENRPVFDEVMPKILLVRFFPYTVYNASNAMYVLVAYSENKRVLSRCLKLTDRGVFLLY